MKIEVRQENHQDNRGGDLVVETRRRRWRVALYYGVPPGSHIGFWRTRVDDLRGWNMRAGRRYVGPTLTVFVHTRRRNAGGD